MEHDPPVQASPERPSRLDFSVVAVGASAGGLPALTGLLGGLPPDFPAAVVVLTHTVPDAKSRLAQVLAGVTRLPVREMAAAEPARPGQVYVLPSGKDATIEDGLLRLADRAAGQPHHPVDAFLTALARDQGPGAIAVILSGAGSDGALGVRHVNAAGGLVLVQQPDTALHDSMPQSALRTGVVDMVLPVEAMAEALARAVPGQELLDRHGPDDASERETRAALDRILALLLEHTGHDLGGYKTSTVLRRIHKRMLLAGVDDLAAYADRLAGNDEERTRLFGDLLIGVTAFFRDQEAFSRLARTALPSLFKGVGPNDVLRTWVACCATGEEAYTVAMLLAEGGTGTGEPRAHKIFATDIDAAALDVARKGAYPLQAVEAVGDERLAAWFSCDGETCSVTPELREHIVFAAHDLLRDPPFLGMDLIVCRNFLIYLNADIQAKVIALFSHALRPGGYLLLGPAETIGENAALFDTVDKKWRLFRRKATAVGVPDMPSRRAPLPRLDITTLHPRLFQSGPDHRETAERLLLDRYAPPAVLLDRDGQVLRLVGDTNPYLELGAGAPSLAARKLARKPLRPHLRRVVEAAMADGAEHASGPVPADATGQILVDIHAVPAPDARGRTAYVLVVFERVRPGIPGYEALSRRSESEATLVERYETEMELLGDQLQRSVAGYETMTEELKASNEELVSMNEELQSSNEEMEASREELQALNEELTALNAELQAKIDEVATARAFVENLLAATELATVVLDRSLAVVRYTPAAAGLFHLIPTDEGRPLEQVKTMFDAAGLLDDCRRVMAGGGVVEREFGSEGGRWFLERACPYRAPSGEVAGVVLTFTDVTVLKEAEAVLRRGNEELEALVARRTEELREKARLLDLTNTMVRDLEGRITFWSDGCEHLLGWSREEAVGRIFHELLRTRFPEPLEDLLAILLREGRWSGELGKTTRDGRNIEVSVTWVLNRDGAGRPVSVLEVANDVTERNRLEEQARRWNRVFEAAGFGLAHIRVADNTFIEVNRAFARQRGYEPGELAGRSLLTLFPPEEHERIREVVRGFDATGHGVFETEHLRKDGSRMPVLVEVTVLRNAVGVAVSRMAYALDITERKKTEEAVRDMARFPSENPNPVMRVGPDMAITHANAASEPFLRDTGSGVGLPFPQACQQAVREAFASGQITQIEHEAGGRYYVFALRPVASRGYVNIYGMDITARKGAEQALARSEARYHNLFDRMGEGGCLLEMVRDDTGRVVDYRVLDVNPGYTAILGIPRQKAVGALVRELFGLDEPPNRDAYARIVATGQPETFDTYFEPLGKYLRISAFSLVSDQFAVLFQDVTESVRAGQALAASEERLRQLVDMAPDAIIIQSGGRFAYLNPAAVRLFGASSAEELLGRDILEHMHPDSREIVRQRIRLTNEERLTQPVVELVYLRQDGTGVPVEAVAAPFDYEGRPGSLVFVRDISERRRVAEEKRRQADLAQAVARIRDAYVSGQPPEAVFGTALEEILRLTGSGYGFVAEMQADEKGRSIQRFLAISSRTWETGTPGFFARYAPTGQMLAAMDGLAVAAAGTGEPVIANRPREDSRASGRLPDEHPRLDNFLGLPMIHGRECMGSIGLANREGGFHQAQADFVRPLVDACAQIVERLRADRRLVAAKQAAEAASLSKSEFLANMSHEIRTPLNGILGMLQLMQTTDLDHEQLEYVDHAVKSSHRLTRLLSDILDLSLVESGRLSIHNAPCSPADLRAAVMDLFVRPAREKGVSLSVSLDPALPAKIMADEVRLRQILFNLVGNAVKFTDRGQVALDIGQASPAHDAAFRVLVAVADTGIGIPDDQLDAIFEPFGQVEGAYMRRFGGAGLGLSIVRRLVALMGGEIAVDSEEGRGTTVYVSLPLGRVPPDAPPAGEERGRQVAAAGLRLLLAEDDAVSSLSFARMLEKAGYRVDTAEDGAEALAKVAAQDYDLILMDVQMPGMDGVAATRAIRTDPALRERSRVPIIAMTAYAMAGDRETFLAAGMDDYVSKPVDLDVLIAAIERVRTRRRGDRDLVL